MKLHWHKHNPWKDDVVYVPVEELAAALAGGEITEFPEGKKVSYTVEYILKSWRHYGETLDAYILPKDERYKASYHSAGVRYGPRGFEYLSVYARHRAGIEELLKKYGGEKHEKVT